MAAIGLGSMVGLLAVVLFPGSPSRLEQASALEISPLSLNLGHLWEQREFKHTLVIYNTSDREISIGRLDASCGCTSIAPQALTIPGRGQARVNLTVDLQDRGMGQLVSPGSPFELSFLAYSQFPGFPLRKWTLACNVRPPIALPAQGHLYLDGPNIRDVADTWKKQTFSFPCAADIQKVEAVPGCTFIAVESSIVTNQKGSEWYLTIIPSPQAELGYFSCPVTITPFTGPDKATGPLLLTCHGQVVQRYFATPDTLHLDPDESGEQAIVLQSRTMTPFRVQAVASSMKGCQIEPPQSDGEQLFHRFVVRVSPEVNPEGSLSFRIADNTRDTLVTVPITRINAH